MSAAGPQKGMLSHKGTMFESRQNENASEMGAFSIQWLSLFQ
jgi:hypothetical protein